MKKAFFGIIFAMLSAFAFAGGTTSRAVGEAGFNKLSETEKTEIIRNVAEKAAARQEAESPLTEDRV